MGCDIHTRVEYLNHNGEWVSGDLFRIIPDYGEDSCETDQYRVVELCGERNYELFAVLADVRNYSGLPYIEEPRGIPSDACDQTRRAYEDMECDAHSASWFTLRELIDWNAKASDKVKRSGMVCPEDAKKLDEEGVTPQMWCGMTTNKTWVYREWEEEYKPLDHLIEELKRRGYDLWLWFGDEMAEKNADKLRFVFWFDN